MKTVKYYIPLFSLLSIALSSCNSTAAPPPPPQSLINHVAEAVKHQVDKKVHKAADAIDDALKPKPKVSSPESSSSTEGSTITEDSSSTEEKDLLSKPENPIFQK